MAQYQGARTVLAARQQVHTLRMWNKKLCEQFCQPHQQMRDWKMPRAALLEIKASDYSYNFEDIYLVEHTFNPATTASKLETRERPRENLETLDVGSRISKSLPSFPSP